MGKGNRDRGTVRADNGVKVPEQGAEISHEQLKAKVELQEREIDYLRDMVYGLHDFLDVTQNNVSQIRQNLKAMLGKSPMSPKQPEPQSPKTKPQ